MKVDYTEKRVYFTLDNSGTTILGQLVSGIISKWIMAMQKMYLVSSEQLNCHNERLLKI